MLTDRTFEHEQLLVRRGARSGLTCVVAVHSTQRGPSLGGCRLWGYAAVADAVADALRLSRAMTWKSSAAGLALGGGKGVIMAVAGEPLSRARRRAALLDFADTVQALDGRYITAEDVGTSSRDMSLIATGTPHVAGLARSRGGSGDPSPFTALGVVEAIEVACERRLGVAGVRGRTVSVLGLGHVGARVAGLLARRGASLVVSDLDPAKRAVAERLGARWTDPARALTARVDVLAPCALGGVIDAHTLPRLRCAVIAGAANNQLADDALAAELAGRGILWAPDFVANAGGIINIAAEAGGYDPVVARRRVRGIGDTMREVFAAAELRGVTPLQAAMELARSRLDAAAAAATRQPG